MFFSNGYFLSEGNWRPAGPVNLAILLRICSWVSLMQFCILTQTIFQKFLSPPCIQWSLRLSALHLLRCRSRKCLKCKCVQYMLCRITSTAPASGINQSSFSEQLCWSQPGGGRQETNYVTLGEECHCPGLWGAVQDATSHAKPHCLKTTVHFYVSKKMHFLYTIGQKL